MKRVLILILILLIWNLPLIAVEPFRVTGKTNDGGLRVRSEPTLNAEVVGSLPDNTELEILGMTDDPVPIGDMSARWFHFVNKWDGEAIEGWAYGFFIDVEPDELLAKAIWTGGPELIRKLIEEGADVSARLIEEGLSFTQYELYEYKSSPLTEAVKTGNRDTVRILIDAGADPDIRTIYGEPGGSTTSSALILAAALDAPAIVELLIMAGSDLEIEGMEFGGGGEKMEVTALSTAAALGNTTIARYLLEAGADPNHEVTSWHITDGELSKTAMDIAGDSGNSEVVELLQSYGGLAADK